MAPAVGTLSDFTSLAGNFKPKFYKKLNDDRLAPTPLLDMVSFDKRATGIANEFDIPIPLTHHTGGTFQAAGGTATLNNAVPAVIKFAKVTNQEIVHVLPMSYGVIQAAANGDDVAYADLNMIKMLELGKGILRDQELSHLHGGQGLGVVTGTPTNSGSGPYTCVVTLTAASWGEGIWKFCEGSPVDSFTALSGGSQHAGATTVATITAIDPVNKKLTLQSATQADMTGIAAGDILFRRGSRGTESAGLSTILQNSSTLFNIDASAYSAWKAVQYGVGSVPLTFAKAVRAIASAVSGGLKSDIEVIVSPPVWGGLMLDQAGLRRYPSKPGSFENGAASVVLATETGKIEFVSHPYAKDGEALAFPVKLAMRVGTTDPSDKVAGLNLEVMDATTASFQFRMWAGEAFFVRLPAQCVYMNGIVAPV